MGMIGYKYSSSFLDDKIFAMGEDIALEVLCRLPVKSLFRFKCVSKKWNSFINHPAFAMAYMRRSKVPNKLTGFIHRLHMSELLYSPSDAVKVHFIPDADDALEVNSNAMNENLIRAMKLGDQSILFIDSHNGLLLCCDNKTCPSHYYVCNPITKHYIALPDPPKRLFYATAKLLFRPQQDQFMVFRILSWKSFSSVIEIETFSSQTGEWKETTLSLPRPTFAPPRRCPTVLGESIYWIDDARLYAYDTWEERFHHRVLPTAGTLPAAFKNCCLWASGGSLYYVVTTKGVLEMWALTVLTCNSAMWTLRHRISLSMLVQQEASIYTRLKELHKDMLGASTGTISLNFYPLALHHHNPKLVFFRVSGMIIRYDTQKAKLEVVIEDCRISLPDHLMCSWAFPIELPVWPVRLPTLN